MTIVIHASVRRMNKKFKAWYINDNNINVIPFFIGDDVIYSHLMEERREKKLVKPL